jgi:adenine-specific DNA-methyltransferase
MASLTKAYNSQKLLGQVYTPRFIVEKILSDSGFDAPERMLGKCVLDPSCGDGRFLVVIAEKIIACSPKHQLKENLEKIYGWDIDPQATLYCHENLNKLIEGLGIDVAWNVSVCNSLKKIKHPNTKLFDFIVGNPPYVRIQHLEEDERKFIQTHYRFCKKGSTDAYIAFYELCYSLLEKNGVCGLITPNTFFYSETGYDLRTFFAKQKNLIQITNYGDIQLFENATTYSAITLFGKQPGAFFTFEQALNKESFESRRIPFSELEHRKFWQLSSQETLNQSGIKLSELCDIHVGVTTLCDKAYIFSIQNNSRNPELVAVHSKLSGTLEIERAALKPIIKASKLKSTADAITEYILFPYEKHLGKHRIIPEEKLKHRFPLAYAYLVSVKPELDKRDNGKPNSVAWYAFGRSQGLDTSFGKKILFSPINNKPNFILVDNEDSTFYSGYCIKYNGDYDFLLEQLNSKRLADFIAVSSRDFRNGWKAYNKKR